MAISFYIGAYFTIDMFVGTVILFIWERENRKECEEFAGTFASGLICGDGVWTAPSAILSILRIDPPICMCFKPTLTMAELAPTPRGLIPLPPSSTFFPFSPPHPSSLPPMESLGVGGLSPPAPTLAPPLANTAEVLLEGSPVQRHTRIRASTGHVQRSLAYLGVRQVCVDAEPATGLGGSARRLGAPTSQAPRSPAPALVSFPFSEARDEDSRSSHPYHFLEVSPAVVLRSSASG